MTSTIWTVSDSSLRRAFFIGIGWYTAGMQITPLDKAILTAIAYADGFDYPLTELELAQWLWTEQPLSESPESVGYHMEVLAKEDLLEQDRGFWCLRGRQEIVDERLGRHLIARRKFRRARRFAWLLSWLPFVRGIAIVNTPAWDHARDGSDIDLLIIVRSGHLWTARFFVAGLLQLLHVRPRGSHTRDAICASFFLADDALDLHEVMIGDDVYMHYWLASVYPLWEAGRGAGDAWPLFDQLWEANAWIRKRLPYAESVIPHATRRIADGGLRRAKRIFLEVIFGWSACERWFERWQRRIMPAELRDKAASSSTDVVLDQHMLKLHTLDRRAEIRDRWRATLAKLDV